MASFYKLQYILLATQTVLQNTFCSAVMRMDYIAMSDLKWLDFIGEGIGALFCWEAITKWRWNTRLLSGIGLGCVTAYALIMHFIVSVTTPSWMLVLPLIVCGIGHVMIFITLTVYVQANCNFAYYFQVLCILGFVRTGVGGPIGDAFFERSLNALMPYDGLIGGIRELYGAATLIGVVAIMIICLSFYGKKLRSV